MKPYRAVIVATLALVLQSPARAQLDEFTAYDWATLPKYCDARLRGDQTVREQWSQQLGHDIFLHMHHYCFGLHFLNKAKLSVDKSKKKVALSRAVSEFDYVIKRWPAGSSLRAEAMRHQQQARLMIVP